LFYSLALSGIACTLGSAGLHAQTTGAATVSGQPKQHRHHSKTDKTEQTGFPAGTPKVWEDRGALTPSKVYWGEASLYPDPLSRVPAPPFSDFEKDSKVDAWSPKGKLKDSKGVKWTAKLGDEAHADVVAPRLAWALGFGTVEGYYVGSGTIGGVDAKTDLGRARQVIGRDGSFSGGARFKRHNKDNEPIKNAKGDDDLYWDEGKNPGVPPEQLSGLLIFDMLVSNWDAQPKNCKVYHKEGPNGPENWYIVSDMGASFADHPKHKFILADYEKDPDLIKSVNGDMVEFNFSDANRFAAREHEQIPLAHAQWFRKQLAKLTDDELQAAFDAAFATDALNRAYASGDPAKIAAARQTELSTQERTEIAGFVAKLRARIDEFMRKIPAS
jgi:hypothetical protein